MLSTTLYRIISFFHPQALSMLLQALPHRPRGSFFDRKALGFIFDLMDLSGCAQTKLPFQVYDFGEVHS
jgi:hypothetical protein